MTKCVHFRCRSTVFLCLSPGLITWLRCVCLPVQYIPESQCILGVVALWQFVHTTVHQVIRHTQGSIINPLRRPGDKNRYGLETRAGRLEGRAQQKNRYLHCTSFHISLFNTSRWWCTLSKTPSAASSEALACKLICSEDRTCGISSCEKNNQSRKRRTPACCRWE